MVKGSSRLSVIHTVGAVSTLAFLMLACGSSAPEVSTADQSGSIQENRQAPSLTEEELPATEPEPTPIPPTATPLPIGMSRSLPFPTLTLITVPNWDVQVLETVRGDEAWQAIQSANQFNDPPPDGMEYLLVKLYAKSTYVDSEEHSISRFDFQVTGDHLIKYSAAPIVVPDPDLDATLYSGGETEGWAAYLVSQGEGDLILIVDELLSFDEDRLRFVALTDGATVFVSPEIADIKPSDLGVDRASPAPYNETVVTEDWVVTVLEVIRGDEAWAMVQEANQFNDPPEAGMEYIAIKVHVRNISTTDEAAQIDDLYFNTTGSAGVLYDLPSVVDPDPPLDISLFPGGESEGWVILQAAQGENNLMAVFEPWFDFGDQNMRFLSLEP